MATFITYDKFNPNFLSNRPPQQITPKTPNVPPYHLIPLEYNFGTEDSPKPSDFDMEWCELCSYSGIENNGKGESIKVFFNTNIEEQQQLVDVLNEEYDAATILIDKNKGAVKKFNFKASDPSTLFKHPIFYPQDQTTGAIIPGKLGTTYLKLRKGRDQTIFCDINNKPVDYDLLRDSEIRFIPVVTTKNIFVGGATAMSLQKEIKSAIVTHIKPRNQETNQVATIQRILLKNPNAQSELEDQIAKLKMSRQSKMPPSLDYQAHSDGGVGGEAETNSLANIPSISDMVKNTPKRQFNIKQ